MGRICGWGCAASGIAAAVALCAVWAAPAYAQGKPLKQTVQVNDTIPDPFAGQCGFAVSDREIGTLRTTSYPDGDQGIRVVMDENLRVTSTNESTGRSVNWTQSLRFSINLENQALGRGETVVTNTTKFTGLNFRFDLPGKPVISAGIGRVGFRLWLDADGNVTRTQILDLNSPHFPHFSLTICGIMFGVGPNITGTVRDDTSHKVLPNICVLVYDAATGDPAGFGLTTSDGTYHARGISTPLAGRYKLQFRDCGPPFAYFSEWYKDRSTFASADAVSVAGRDVQRVDANLARGGTISGRVTDAVTGAGLNVMCVQAFDASGAEVGDALTGADGSYQVGGGLTTGSYRVLFSDCFSLEVGYQQQWYRAKPDLASANPIAVVQGKDTGSINAALLPYGQITGTVRDAGTGMPITGNLDPSGILNFDICVVAHSTTDGAIRVSLVRSDGNYTIESVPPGSYKVEFVDCGMHKYVGAWYRNKPDEASADPVSVALATTTSGIDASLAVGGTISGTITDASTNLPLAAMCVDVTGPTSVFGSEQTAADGSYHFGGLGTGDYKVKFGDCGAGVYATEWYDAKPDDVSADAVHVVVGHDTPGIDAALATGGAITGTVTDAATGTPLEGICVGVVSPATGDTVAFAATGADGSYSAAPIFTGSYKVAYDDCSSGVYATEWYDNKATFSAADTVSVVNGHATGGIDAALEVGGTISGTVTDATSGAPLDTMCVEADRAGGPEEDPNSRFFAITGPDGTYTLRPLITGSYTVHFYDCANGVYLDQYYHGKLDQTSADPVGVVIGENTSGINAALVRAP